MMSPSSSFALVRALNCLQNSIILICACPRAGPTGGAGVAFPAAICSFTEPVTFFAIPQSSSKACAMRQRRSTRGFLLLCHLLHLIKLELNRRRAAENRDHHLQRLAVLVDFIHDAGKARERSFRDANRFILFELDLEFGLVLALVYAIDDVVNLFF